MVGWFMVTSCVVCLTFLASAYVGNTETISEIVASIGWILLTPVIE